MLGAHSSRSTFVLSGASRSTGDGAIRHARKKLALYGNPSWISLWRLPGGIRPRRRPERNVFAETRRGQSFRRAGKQREERAAGRVGPPAAMRKERRNAGATQCAFHQGLIRFRISKENRHPIEGNIMACGEENRTGDLDALSRFVGRRPEFQRAIEFIVRRRRCGEHMLPEPVKRR